MTTSSPTLPYIQCYHCGNQFLPVFTDAPICTNCGTVHTERNQSKKSKTTTADFAIHNLKIERINNGVQLSWQSFSVPMRIIYSIVAIYAFVAFSGIATNLTGIMRVLGMIAYWLAVSPVIYFAAGFIFNRHIITITADTITIHRQPLPWPRKPKVIAISNIEDVLVRANENMITDYADEGAHYHYQVFLKTPKESIKMINNANEHLAAYLAHRIKTFARIQTQPSVPPQAIEPTTTAPENKTVPKPKKLDMIQTDKSITLTRSGKDAALPMPRLPIQVLAAFFIAGTIGAIISLFGYSAMIVLLTQFSIALIIVPLLLYAYLRSQQKATITITDDNFTVTHNNQAMPIINISTQRIEQVFLVQHYVLIERDEKHYQNKIYKLRVLTSDDDHGIDVATFHDKNQAQYVRQQFAQFIGI